MSDIIWTNCTVKLGDLKPWQDNPRTSTKAQAKRILASFDRFGQVAPIAIDPDNNVLDGHQRLSALLTIHGADYEVEARRSSRPLTDDERRALVLALANATGSWNWDSLSNWSTDTLKEWGFDKDTLGGWKSDVTALGEFLKSEAPAVDAEPQTDRAAELLEKWQVKTGDLWQIGGHRLICGDCTDKAVVERVMESDTPAMIWSDPPYGLGGYAGRSGKLEAVEGDDASEEEIINFFSIGNAPEIYVCCEWKTYPYLLQARGEPRSLIVWAKQVFGMGRGYRRQHEFIGYYGKFDSTTESDLWSIDRGGGYIHPTEKPVDMPARAIGNSTKEGDVVFDPFSGTAPSLIACENLSRKCCAVEISPAYVSVALERMSVAFPHLEIKRLG